MAFIRNGLAHPTSYLSFMGAFANPLNYIGGVSFKPDRDIEDLTGKVILITGGNTGLGKETVLQLAKHNPSKIFLAARTESKARDAIKEIKEKLKRAVDIIWLPLDLSDLESIKAAVKTFAEQSTRLDRLILNAGIMAVPPGKTSIGHEVQFGTNHTGHFLLTQLLLPTLLKTAEEPGADVRVVALASIGHNLAPPFQTFTNQEKLNTEDPYIRYGAAKASNILAAAELARRYPSLTSVSLHPGVIVTDLYKPAIGHVPFGAQLANMLAAISPSIADGALNTLYLAAGAKKSDIVNGSYYVPVGNCKKGNAYAKDVEKGKELYDWTEAELRRAGALEQQRT